MIIDARGLPDGLRIDAEICIVGAGVAGITLAREFARVGLSTCVIEGGGWARDSESQSLYEGESTGIPYDLVNTRSRYVGGSSNCWGGWCRPFSPIDFDSRSWVDGSGWPFALADLSDAYRRARDLLQVGHLPDDPGFWLDRLSGRVRNLPLPSGAIETRIAHFSPPARLGRIFRPELERSSSIRLLLHANAVGVAADRSGTRAEGVRIRTEGGRTIFVSGREVILAAGGIENARLMLLSNDVQPAGLGNGHDLVGRYFMDHPRIPLGRITLRDPYGRRLFHDVRYSFHNPRLAVDGISASAYFGLSEQIQRAEGLLQCRTYLFACYPEDEHPAVDGARRIRDALQHGSLAIGGRAALSVVAGAPSVARALLRSGGMIAPPPTHLIPISVLEPVPDPESRVTLSERKDRFGCNQARLHWRVGELERRTHLRMLSLLKREIEGAGLGSVEIPDDEIAEDRWRNTIAWAWHHMGTTRMHPSPRLGVVDTDSRVHGLSNLYVAGSSVFPTGGNDMPTLTITALALRLADHLRAQRERSTPVAAEAVAEMAVPAEGGPTDTRHAAFLPPAGGGLAARRSAL